MIVWFRFRWSPHRDDLKFQNDYEFNRRLKCDVLLKKCEINKFRFKLIKIHGMNESLAGQKHKFIQNLTFIIQFQRVSVTIGFFMKKQILIFLNYKYEYFGRRDFV